MNEKLKKFADEYVILFFHTPGVSPDMVVEAANFAGYEIPTDKQEADALYEQLMMEAAEYINTQIEAFRAKFAGDQRRNLWGKIAAFTPATPHGHHFGNIIIH